MSYPDEKLPPAPRRMTSPTFLLWRAIASTCSSRASKTSLESAFSFSGRFKVSVAAPRWSSRKTRLVIETLRRGHSTLLRALHAAPSIARCSELIARCSDSWVACCSGVIARCSDSVACTAALDDCTLRRFVHERLLRGYCTLLWPVP